MRLALHVLADCVAVTLIALFAFWLLSGEFFPRGYGRLFTAIWIYTIPIAAAGHWLLPRAERFVVRWSPVTQWLALVGQLVVIGLIGSLLGSIVVFGIDLQPGASFLEILSLATKLVIYLTVSVGIVHAMVIILMEKLTEAQREAHEKELETERARNLASEARLASLESHLQPHFLFNTLNTISSLIESAPDKAERLIERISNLLRFSLNNRERGLVPLEQELRIVRDYLEIERERFGERLQFSIEAEPTALQCNVPPLSVQTLVENSVKHAVSPNRSGARIRVGAEISDGALAIKVADTGPGFSLANLPNGHGLENLRDRLAALFDDSEPLGIKNEGGWTTVGFSVSL